jgi:hypothetical protein
MIENIILVAGKSGSGKDTFSDYFTIYQNFKKYAFADLLKKQVSLKHGIPLFLTHSQEGKKQIYKSNINDQFTTIRDLLIEESKKYKENNPHFYTEYIIKCIKKENYKNVIISDFRFPSEFYKIKESFPNVNITTVLIKRTTYNKIDDISEKSLEDFDIDIIINNNFNHVFSFYDYLQDELDLFI